MPVPLPGCIKCEYTVSCEVEAGLTHPQQWRLTLQQTGTILETGADFVLLSAPDHLSACREIANKLHVHCDSISAQIQLHPTSYSDDPPQGAAQKGPLGASALPTTGYDMILSLGNTVFKRLGPGYSESIYHNALSHELFVHNISHEMERVIPVVYKLNQVGVVRADIVVQNNMVIEVKAVTKITTAHLQQAERYAKLLHLSNVIVINFPGHANTCVDACFFDGVWNTTKQSNFTPAPRSLLDN